MRIIIHLIFILAVSSAKSSTMLIADIDDTLKKSNILSYTGVVARAVQDDLAFLGMSQLINSIESENKNLQINYVSNAPELVMIPFHLSFLIENNFPQPGNTYLKVGFDQYHKLRTIYRLLDEQRPDRVILIGDNGENDAQIYETVVKNYPKIQFTVLIRIVYSMKGGGKALRSGQIPFVSSGDLALRLYSLGLMSWEPAYKIISLNLKRTVLDIFRSAGVTLRLPHFVECHDFLAPSSWRKSSAVEIQNLVKAIDDRCTY